MTFTKTSKLIRASEINCNPLSHNTQQFDLLPSMTVEKKQHFLSKKSHIVAYVCSSYRNARKSLPTKFTKLIKF